MVIENLLLNSKVDSESRRRLQTKILEAEKIIGKCLEHYKSHELFLSFNGGKDCTVLLHIVIEFMKRFSISSNPLLCLYIQSAEPFMEVEKFVDECELLYPINLLKMKRDIRTALKDVIVLKPYLKACLMGSRRTDPHCANLHPLQMTDPDWPQVMRVSPLLDWSLTDIWDYLLIYKVPYCKLYDLGYTSLGSRNNTIKNPKLKYIDTATGVVKYSPAFVLKSEDQHERDGRH